MQEEKTTRRRPSGFWLDDANIEREIRGWMQDHGAFPTHRELVIAGRHGLAHAIVARGGYPTWRERFELSRVKPMKRYRWDEATIARVLKEWVEQHGMFPTKNTLQAHDKQGLAWAIEKRGGFLAWRKRLGHDPTKQPKGYWSKEENIHRSLKDWIEARGSFPTAQDLRISGKASLILAVIATGGFPVWRTKLGYGQLQQPRGFWKESANANIEQKLTKIIGAIGRFPTQKELRQGGNTALLSAITDTGGFSVWQIRMGYGRVKPAILKDHADSLVRILFALQVERPALTSDALWCAIMVHWTEADLKTGLTAFTDHGDLTAFRSLLSR